MGERTGAEGRTGFLCTAENPNIQEVVSAVTDTPFLVLYRTNCEGGKTDSLSLCSHRLCGQNVTVKIQQCEPTFWRMSKWRRVLSALRVGYAWLGSLVSYRRQSGFAEWSSCSGERIVCLGVNELIRLNRHSRVARLEVIRGALWVTETPAKGDLLLEPGDQFVPNGGWPIVVQATKQTEILLSHRAQPRREQIPL